MADPAPNVDRLTVEGFGREWTTFTQADGAISDAERLAIFEGYFALFPWHSLPAGSIGADIGCGSGRWAALVAPRVGELHAIDPASDALAVARTNLARITNVRFHVASVSELPFADGTLDFAYSLGVLHHVPDTLEAIRDIAAKLKPGAPFLVYLYYAFDNRGALYRALWHVSDAIRFIFSRLPFGVQRVGTFFAAALVYWPLARVGAALDAIGAMPRSWPLQFYRNRTFYVMRTDAFDRFCTRLEQRFTRPQIADMLDRAGFGEIKFSEKEPFWVALATKL